MHCCACDKLLSDFEATRAIHREDGSMEYPDLCNECFDSSGLTEIDNISITVRNDLATEIVDEDLTYQE